jgi:hypothetical protein
MIPERGSSPAGQRASLLARTNVEAHQAGVPVRRIHLVVTIDRFLVRLLDAVPSGSWVVKGGYANQLRQPDDARFTEDLDLKIEAEIEAATGLPAAGFAIDLCDDFGYEAAAAATPLQGPPGGGADHRIHDESASSGTFSAGGSSWRLRDLAPSTRRAALRSRFRA